MREVSNSIDSYKDILDNGLRVITVEIPHLHALEISMYVKVGARFETTGNNGISHFLEHMLFRGTQNMPDSYQLHKSFESLGGDINAFTGCEYTCFWLTFHPRYLDEGMSLFSDMFCFPKFVDLETEKQIVLEEILNEFNEKGENISIDNLSSMLLWPKESLGLPTLGSKENVLIFTEEDIRSFFKTYYTASNMVLVVAGKVEHEQVLNNARQYFSRLPRGQEARIISIQKSSQKRARCIFKKNSGSQTNVEICFRCPSYNAPDYYALLLLRHILDDGTTSILQWHIRERQGLVYDISANVSSYYDTGTFEIDFSVAPEKISRVLQEVFQEIRKLTIEPVSPDEFQRAKRRFLMEFDFALDSMGKMADRFGWSELFHRNESLEKEREKIAKLTNEEIFEVCRKYFVNAGLNIIVIGQYSREEKKKVNELVKGFLS